VTTTVGAAGTSWLAGRLASANSSKPSLMASAWRCTTVASRVADLPAVAADGERAARANGPAR
jgi:hypothetical protein